MNYTTKYPWTIATVGRQDFILAANLKLIPYTAKDYENGDNPPGPLNLWSKFSGLQLNFANSKGSKNEGGGSGNIELYKLNDIYARTQAMMPTIMAYSSEKQNPLFNSLPFVPNTYGNFAKKSPIEIGRALDFAKTLELGQAMTNSTGKFARSNQTNGIYIQDAAYITEAERMGLIELLDTEEHRAEFLRSKMQDPNYGWYTHLIEIINKSPEYLQLNTAQVKGSVIYEALMKTPHTSKVVDGRTEVYSLSIICNPARPMPFTISLLTGTGIPQKDQQGNIKAVGIVSGSFKKTRDFSLDVTSAEWLNIISTAVQYKNACETSLVPQAMTQARQIDNMLRQAAKQQAQPVQQNVQMQQVYYNYNNQMQPQMMNQQFVQPNGYYN